MADNQTDELFLGEADAFNQAFESARDRNGYRGSHITAYKASCLKTLKAYLVAILGNIDDAEDALIEISLILETELGDIRHLHKLNKYSALERKKRWKKIARNRAIDILRKRRYGNVPIPVDFPALEDHPDDVILLEKRILDQKQDSKKVIEEFVELFINSDYKPLRDFLAKLTKKQQTIFVLHSAAGWSAELIGTHTGTAESTVYNHLYEARKRLGIS